MRPAFVLLPLVALALAVLLALGGWQLVRLREAQRTEVRREAQVAAPALAWPDATARAPAELDFHRVTVKGRWDPTVLLLANRIRFDTKGEEIVQALLPDGGGPALLVNRGWYPLERKAEVLAALDHDAPATVTGLARYVPDERARETSAGAWSRVDPPTMQPRLGVDLLPWYVIQGERVPSINHVPGALPDQHFQVLGPQAPHLEYAATWFSLAAALAVTTWLRLRPRRAPPPPAPAPSRAR